MGKRYYDNYDYEEAYKEQCKKLEEAEMIKLSRDNFPLKAIKLQNLLEQSILLSRTFFQLHTFQVIELCQQS